MDVPRKAAFYSALDELDMNRAWQLAEQRRADRQGGWLAGRWAREQPGPSVANYCISKLTQRKDRQRCLGQRFSVWETGDLRGVREKRATPKEEV